MKQTNITLDELCRQGLENFPRSVSMSSIIRCLLKAATTSDEKKWKELVDSDEELMLARNAIRDYLKSTGRRTIAL